MSAPPDRIPPTHERIPTDFLTYWHRLNSPWVQRARAASRTVFGFDPVLPDETVRKWAYGYYDADPVAEAFVDDAYLAGNSKDGRRMLDLALAQGVAAVPDGPASLRRLFAELEQDPPLGRPR